MSQLDRGTVAIHYEVYGKGPALLLSNGYSATTGMWSPNIEALSENFTLILWDMRGHGHSSSPAEDIAYSEALTTQDMAALLDHLGFESAVIGGLSLGGYMSLAFNLDYPERVNALLIIDTGPGFKNESARAEWNKSAMERADDLENQGEAALDASIRENTKSGSVDCVGLARAARYMLTQSSPRVIESLPNITKPSLVLVGADDTPFLAAAEYMAKKIPKAEKLVIPNAGHLSNVDQPDLFDEGVLQFLNTLSGLNNTSTTTNLGIGESVSRH